MRYVKLSDGTRIENCDDRTTAFEIYAVRDSNTDAASVADLITRENSRTVKVYNAENDELLSSANNLKITNQVVIEENKNYFISMIALKPMDRLDIIEEEIAELQEAILG